MELYDATIAYVKYCHFFGGDIHIRYEDKLDTKKIVGFKYKNYIIDAKTRETYIILVNENSTKLELGFNCKNIKINEKYVILYKKHIFDREIDEKRDFEILFYKKMYDEISSKFKFYDRFFFANLTYINEVKTIKNDKDIVNINDNGITIGMIINDKFIDLKDKREYDIAPSLMDNYGNTLVDEDKTYATNLLELEDDQITDKILEAAAEYKEPMSNIISFTKKKRYKYNERCNDL